MNEIENAVETITNKVSPYTALYRYLDGNAPLKYSTDRLQRAFNKSFVYFSQNWGSIVVNAVLDRLILKGFDVGNESQNKAVDALFTKLNLNLDAQDVHEAVEVTGEGFLIVDVVDGETDVYFNDPRLCAVFYNSDRPKIKDYAAKLWVGEDGKKHLKLYYTDRTEEYISNRGSTAKSYVLVGSVPNTTGVIPVFHFRSSRRTIVGEFDQSTISVLDAINKLFSDLMVAAEFETFKIKVFISQTDPGDIKIGPDMHLWLPSNETGQGQDSNIIELGGSTLDNFLKPITDLATTLAITTRTPRSLFMNSGANVSGEALVVEESGIVKKVEKIQQALEPTWKEVISYILSIYGTKLDSSQIIVNWNKAETDLPLTDSQVTQADVAAGMPLITSKRRQNWSNEELIQLEEDISNKTNTVVTV